MKDKILKLARGTIDQDVPKLQMSNTSFRGSFEPGEVHQINTVLSSLNDVPMKGLIYSTNSRVRAEKAAFGGLRSRIGCEVSTIGLKDGDVIEGMLILVCNAGEWQLPYLFSVRKKSRKEQEAGLPEVQETAASEEDATAEAATLTAREIPGAEEEKSEGGETAAAADAREEKKREAREHFLAYEEAVRNESRELHLFEHFLAAVPEDWKEPFPREIYLYFSYETQIEDALALTLYENILRNFGPETETYQRYERRIQFFAIDSLLRGEIDDKLAYLYQMTIQPDLVDRRMARVLPVLLETYRITLADDRFRTVVVRYPALKEPSRFPLTDGTAYVPLYFPDADIYFEGKDGRYYRTDYEKKKLWDSPALLARCREMGAEEQDKNLRRMQVGQILKNGIQKLPQLRLLVESYGDAQLTEDFRERIVDAVLRYYERMKLTEQEQLTEQDLSFLREISDIPLRKETALSLFQILVRLGELACASRLFRSYGTLKPTLHQLEQVIGYQIEQGEVSPETAHQAFLDGSRSPALLCYLLQHYNSVSWYMLEILREGYRVLCPKGQTPETEAQEAILAMADRLLCQMLFTGMEDGITEVYHIYEEMGGSDRSIQRAFLTRQAARYFLRERKIEQEWIAALYQIIHGEPIKERLPIIYLLAMTKSMAEREELTSEEKLELQEMMNVLLEKKLVFAYTETLRRFIPLPDYVLNRSYIEYRGEETEHPQLFVKVLPEEEEYREMALPRVYQNIYAAPITLFSGEQAVYKILKGGSELPLAQGTVQAREEQPILKSGDIFESLNHMAALSAKGDTEALREEMLRYTKNEAMIRILFARGDKIQ